jgi:protein-S-isoprenylcysteine O-methyltransferase Ste14
MALQIFFTAFFALNILLVWATFLSGRLKWYPALGEIFIGIIPFLTVFWDQPRFELDFFWWRVAGAAAMIMGLGIMVWAVLEFRKEGMLAEKAEHKFVTSGPYRFVRHPQYLGLVFMAVGWWWIWAAVYAFYFGMIILALTWIEAYLEEKFILEKRFGDQYRDYRRHAGMFWIK